MKLRFYILALILSLLANLTDILMWGLIDPFSVVATIFGGFMAWSIILYLLNRGYEYYKRRRARGDY